MLTRRCALVVCVSILVVLAIPASIRAQEPSDRTGLSVGISQIRAKDFVNALVTLNDVVARQANRPEQAATLARAHAYRAVAFIGLEQPDWARGAALEALKADPQIVIAASEFGSRVAALFASAQNASSDPETAGQAAEAAGRFQDAFLGYLSALQSLPDPPPPAADQRLRERIINVVRKLEPKPTVPEEARTRLMKAEALLDADAVPGASSDQAAEQAAVELRKAARIAPWWPDVMVRLAVALQRADRIDEARINLSLYQSSMLDGNAVDTAARSAPAAAASAADASAVIYVYFPHATRGMGVNSKVLCDGQKVADLGNGRFITLRAPSGFHKFEFKRQKVAASFAGGTEQYLRVGIEGYPAHFVLRLTEPGQAVAEMRDKQVIPNDPTNTFSAECASVAAAPAATKSR